MSRTVFLTVHGTFDGISNPAEPRWWEPTSAFWQAIFAPSPYGTLTGAVQSFVWSGKNSAYEREVAARALVKQLKALRKSFDHIHLIGHSHGGNVIEDALERIAWNGARRPSRSKHKNPSKIRSVTTLGTPFLDRRESTLRKVLIVLMLLLVVMMLLGTIALAVAVWLFASAVSSGGAGGGGFDTKLLTILAIVAIIPLIFLLPLLLLFIRNWHTLRFRRRNRTPANWLSIFHPQDEAMFLLSSANSSAYEFYQRGVISANVRRKIDAAMIFFAAAALVLFAARLSTATMNWGTFTAFGQTIEYTGVPLLLGGFFLLLIPFFGIARLFVGFFDLPLRSWANGQIRAILRALSFGEDHHVKLAAVAAVPFVYECSGVAVTGPTGECMATEAKASFINYVNASHQCISWQSAKANSDAIGDMLMGLTTVRTIHSSYFHQPEIVAMITEHMLRSEPAVEPQARAG